MLASCERINKKSYVNALQDTLFHFFSKVHFQPSCSLIKLSLYGKAKSQIYFLFPNRLHSPSHQWEMMVGNFSPIKVISFSESAVRKNYVEDFRLCELHFRGIEYE